MGDFTVLNMNAEMEKSDISENNMSEVDPGNLDNLVNACENSSYLLIIKH